MIEQGLVKTHFLGRDGFIWWIGQIVDQTKWAGNLGGSPTKTTEDQKGFGFRYKVRIMGYHTASPTDLTDDDLPWASVMLPVTAGVSGGAVSTPNLRQGDFVQGYFLDGEDAQQPVIMGVIGYNQYTAVMKNIPDTGFLPFSGYTTEDQVPQGALPTNQEEAKGVAEDVDVSKTNNKEVLETGVSQVGRDDGATNEQYLNEKKSSTIASNADCEKAPTGSIQREIKNMIAEVQRIKKTATDWETKVSTKVDNIDKEIAKIKDNTTKAITGDVKRITAELQKNALKKVNDAMSDTYYEVFPTELPLVKEKADEANTELACAFKNIMKNLSGMIGSFLDQISDKVINTRPCTVENFLGSLLGKISGLIDSAVSSVMKPIKAMLAGMGIASSSLDDVMGFATDLLSFLSCDEEPKCSDVKEWNPVNGPEKTTTVDLFSIVNKAKEAASLVQNAVEGFSNIGDAISNVANNADFSDIFKDSCDVGPVYCGPPTVEFIGGGGSGATGNVIVSALTTVLGVDIITPGGGYIGAPRVKFIDSCDKGRGAVGRAVMGQVPVQVRVPVQVPVQVTTTLPDGGTVTNTTLVPDPTGATTLIPDPTGATTLGVTNIVMDDTGIDYLPAPDGSQGGDGRTWAGADETTVKRSDGTYDTPYQPGTVVDLDIGDEWTPAGGGTILVTEPVSITTPLPTGTTTGVTPGGTTTGVTPGGTTTGGRGGVPSGTKGPFPSTGAGDYPVVLEIDDINITNPGFGYNPDKDKIIIETSDGTSKGAELKIKTDPLGSLIGVDVVKGGIGFNEDPKIYIQSDSGYNAKMIPVFKVNRVGEDSAPEIVAAAGTPGVVQVIDCVGKV
tara:strand:+ start:191 stop:2719 length:2529 start_codon:yes stop_codon:yes gene_type:complete